MSKSKKHKFDQDMTIGQVLAINPNAEAVLLGFGMHCVGCFVSQMETLGEACEVHGVDIKDVLKALDNMPTDGYIDPRDYIE